MRRRRHQTVRAPQHPCASIERHGHMGGDGPLCICLTGCVPFRPMQELRVESSRELNSNRLPAYAHTPQTPAKPHCLRLACPMPHLLCTVSLQFLWRRAFRLPDGASLSSLWTIYTVSVGVTSARAVFGANDRAGRFWHAFWHGSPHVEDCFRTVSAARFFLLSHESNRSERANSNAA